MPTQSQPIDGDPPIAKTDRMAKARAAKAAKKLAADTQAAAALPSLGDPTVQRTAPRPAENRKSTREPNRDPNELQPRRGAMVVTGRDGEVLSRRMTQVGDLFHVPENEIPQGWDYQWNTVTVTGQNMPEIENQMFANGWRPVPASRHPGRWTAPNYEGAIIVKGMRLEERPSSLGDEARAEDTARAKSQIRDQTDALRLTEKLPQGFASNKKYRGTGGDVRMTIDKGLDIPRPELEVDE